MKTLRDAQKFLLGLIQSGAPLEDNGLGEQSYNCNFVEPHGHNLWMIPHVRIFGTKPVTFESTITSAAVNIGKSNDYFRERDTTCLIYFGLKFRDFESELSRKFDCKTEQVCQIKCKNPSSIQEFIRLLIKLYNEAQQRNCSSYQSIESTDVRSKVDQKTPSIDYLIENLDPGKIQEERERVLRVIDERHGQRVFRQSLLNAYNSRCAISGCSLPAVLEAAHIIPYSEITMDRVQNGILLRSDLHTLFDKGLITIDDDLKVIVHGSITDSQYGKINGRRISVPESDASRPHRKALKWHRENVFKK